MKGKKLQEGERMIIQRRGAWVGAAPNLMANPISNPIHYQHAPAASLRVHAAVHSAM